MLQSSAGLGNFYAYIDHRLGLNSGTGTAHILRLINKDYNIFLLYFNPKRYSFLLSINSKSVTFTTKLSK